LEKYYPTQKHSADFWEHLGRVVATFGFLEEIMAKAYLAFTGNKKLSFNSDKELEEAYEKWGKELEKVATGQLSFLLKKYKEATKDLEHKIDINMLYSEVKEANDIRNMLCHASWRAPLQDGKSPLFYARGKGENLETCQQLIDVEYLKQVQESVADITIRVFETVKDQGFDFPGIETPKEK